MITFEIQMKHLAFILATYISLLTFQPVITKMVVVLNQCTEHCGTNCCDKAKNEENTPKNNCDQNNCNPCQACGNCGYYYYSESSFEMTKNLVTESINPMVNEKAHSDFCSDCFHPPETV